MLEPDSAPTGGPVEPCGDRRPLRFYPEEATASLISAALHRRGSSFGQAFRRLNISGQQQAQVRLLNGVGIDEDVFDEFGDMYDVDPERLRLGGLEHCARSGLVSPAKVAARSLSENKLNHIAAAGYPMTPRKLALCPLCHSTDAYDGIAGRWDTTATLLNPAVCPAHLCRLYTHCLKCGHAFGLPRVGSWLSGITPSPGSCLHRGADGERCGFRVADAPIVSVPADAPIVGATVDYLSAVFAATMDVWSETDGAAADWFQALSTIQLIAAHVVPFEQVASQCSWIDFEYEQWWVKALCNRVDVKPTTRWTLPRNREVLAATLPWAMAILDSPISQRVDRIAPLAAHAKVAAWEFPSVAQPLWRAVDSLPGEITYAFNAAWEQL